MRETQKSENNHDNILHKIAHRPQKCHLRLLALEGRSLGFNPNQPRDNNGRWTAGGIASKVNLVENLDYSKQPEGGKILVVGNDGMSSNRAVQKKEVDAVCRILNLSKEQRRELHDAIHGKNLNFIYFSI